MKAISAAERRLQQSTVRARPGQLRALRIPHSKSYFVWHLWMGAQGR
jgi:hypothetical protein